MPPWPRRATVQGDASFRAQDEDYDVDEDEEDEDDEDEENEDDGDDDQEGWQVKRCTGGGAKLDFVRLKSL